MELKSDLWRSKNIYGAQKISIELNNCFIELNKRIIELNNSCLNDKTVCHTIYSLSSCKTRKYLPNTTLVGQNMPII